MKPSRSALFELGDYESVVRAPEDEVRLRMEIGSLFRKSVIRDESFRDELIENHHWTPSTPAIPCEWSRTVGDVLDAAERFFVQGHDTVAVPVLAPCESGGAKLAIACISRESMPFFAGRDISKTDPCTAIGDLVGGESLSRHWSSFLLG